MDTIAPNSAAKHASIDTGALKKVAQEARRVLRDQVSAKLTLVLAEASAARRETPKALKELEGEIARTSRDQIVERVGYTWFNRFTALRFMDANGYTSVRVVTPANGQTRPEILSEAMAGVIGDDVPEATATQVRALLDNRTPSHDPQGEAYHLLLVATCNHWHAAMPFMFETIADYTELLMPEDLLSQGSILTKLRAVMTDDACRDVEIIGWLYQFYISEKKDEVFAGLKKNVKISAENIPAATQLFTPHWIVRYLVENSLGRLWMLNRPNSRLKERMDYYIAPEEPETDFPRISSPEEIKVCDPACGSGHMLTYAFDLLHAIYEEDGNDVAEIPGLILSHNLYGIEIDERAGALAAFALTMKAAALRKRFLRRGVRPNVCILEPVKFESSELNDYMDAIGRDLFTEPLHETLTQFAESNNFGSLIRPALSDVAGVRQIIDGKDVGSNLFLRDVHARVQKVLRMADYLGPKYHVVVANPPYMGSSGMNPRLKSWVNEHYPKSKPDLMTCFMERSMIFCRPMGSWGMINLPSWLFLSSFEEYRTFLLCNNSISSLIHLGRGIFGSDFGSVAFVIKNSPPQIETRGIYRRLFEKHVDVRSPSEIEQLFLNKSYARYLVSQREFLLIQGSPLAYWASDTQRKAFSENETIGSWAEVKQGLATADNDRFLRLWHEVSLLAFGRKYDSTSSTKDGTHKWFPYNKGGEYRRWFGNFEYVVNWENDGQEIRNFADSNGKIRSRAQNTNYYFKEGVTWTFVSSGNFGVRFAPSGSIFDVAGSSAFPPDGYAEKLTGALASKVSSEFLSLINPTLNFQVGNIASLPIDQSHMDSIDSTVQSKAIDLAKADWDAFETSWDFTTLPLLLPEHRQATLAETYADLRAHWQRTTEEMQRLEEENNRIFIDVYGLEDELTPEVPLQEITVTCNPAYRYGGNGTEAELEERLRSDTVAEFLHYGVGCMFGRYSLDVPGLVLANEGEGLEDYLSKVPNPTYEPAADNVIPVLDGDWFADDIAARFRKFLRITFGDERFQENMAFIEEALGKDIRKYFTRDFFNDHLKRYKKRPIYWLFSSPRGTFNALIYMHRYRPDTVSVVLNDYLREFRSRLEAHRRAQQALSISGDASPAQKTKALKEIEATGKRIEELEAWERDVLFPLATQKIEIDLDDGVKANYPKLGAALKPIKGLNDADD
jgi:type II restriction/modification system DNA methylase subunit YeeA